MSKLNATAKATGEAVLPAISGSAHSGRVNIIIRIEDAADPETASEHKFEDCNVRAILDDTAVKWIHPMLKQYLELLGDSAPNGEVRDPAT